jgi:hypothetical protein
MKRNTTDGHFNKPSTLKENRFTSWLYQRRKNQNPNAICDDPMIASRCQI